MTAETRMESVGPGFCDPQHGQSCPRDETGRRMTRRSLGPLSTWLVDLWGRLYCFSKSPWGAATLPVDFCIPSPGDRSLQLYVIPLLPSSHRGSGLWPVGLDALCVSAGQ